jgi:hypothetical protein
MTNEQILELAKTCGFEEFIGERDEDTDDQINIRYQ